MSKKQAQGLPLSISQNFLTSKRTIERLVRHACLTKHDTVLEIGAGKGHITRCLAQYSGSVIAYELDPALAARLKGRLPENVRLYCADFLTAPLPRTPYKVFANIPFSRTTEILRKLTAAPRAAQNPPGGLWLLVEKGAAAPQPEFPAAQAFLGSENCRLPAAGGFSPSAPRRHGPSSAYLQIAAGPALFPIQRLP